MKFDIIIPHVNDENVDKLAFKCLRSIRTYSTNYHIIWIQNGGQMPNQIAYEMMFMESHEVIWNEDNKGFIEATNQGLAKSTAPFIVFMNNDTEAVPYWLDMLSAPLSRPENGMSGPHTNALGSWQGNPGWVSGPPVPVEKGGMLAFFCVMLRRDVFEKVGYLDKDFGVGFGDDDNYCSRVQAAGFELIFVPELTIPHHHRSTFKTLYCKEKIQEMQDKNLLLHMKKLQAISMPFYRMLSTRLIGYLEPIRAKYGHENSGGNPKQGNGAQQNDGGDVQGSMRLFP